MIDRLGTRVSITLPFVIAFLSLKGSADLISRKPAILKESRLLCTFGQTCWGLRSEFSPADLRGHANPIHGGSGNFLFDLRVGNTLLPKLCADSDRPLTSPGVVMHEGRHESLVRYELLGAELFDDAVDGALLVAFSGQLPLELARAVFAPSEQSDGRYFDFFVRVSGRLR